MYTAVTVDRRQWTGLMPPTVSCAAADFAATGPKRQLPRHSGNANCILLLTLMTWQENEAFVRGGRNRQDDKRPTGKYLPIAVPVGPKHA